MWWRAAFAFRLSRPQRAKQLFFNGSAMNVEHRLNRGFCLVVVVLPVACFRHHSNCVWNKFRELLAHDRVGESCSERTRERRAFLGHAMVRKPPVHAQVFQASVAVTSPPPWTEGTKRDTKVAWLLTPVAIGRISSFHGCKNRAARPLSVTTSDR